MKTGDALAELRAWRDEFARSHAYDVHAMAEALRALDNASERKVIRGEPRRPAVVTTPLQSIGAAAPVSGEANATEAAPAAEQ